MINPLEFIDFLNSQRINYFYGVPDSLLKPLCTNLLKILIICHQVATNEAMAVSSAIGSYLATGDMACVYMQNSGLGNAINPLVSLASKEVYSIPMLLLIGWRGEILNEDQQIKDEPQHSHQGKITLNQLEILNIPHIVLSKESSDWKNKVLSIIHEAKEKSMPVSIVFRKKVFDEKDEDNNIEEAMSYSLTREEIIEIIGSTVPKNIPIFSTTGMTSRELYEFREKKFLLLQIF